MNSRRFSRALDFFLFFPSCKLLELSSSGEGVEQSTEKGADDENSREEDANADRYELAGADQNAEDACLERKVHSMIAAKQCELVLLRVLRRGGSDAGAIRWKATSPAFRH